MSGAWGSGRGGDRDSGGRDVSATLARAEDVLVRQRAAHLGAQPAPALRRRVRVKRKALAIGWLGLALIFAVFIVGVVQPIGTTGLMLAVAAFLVGALIIALWPAPKPPSTTRLAQAPIADLPEQTERWLEARQAALPPPAQALTSEIVRKLETLRPQLITLDANAPIAGEARKLMAEDLPGLIASFEAVPVTARQTARDGFSPVTQLTEGLRVVDTQLGRMSDELARAQVEKLATQGRYLEMKYRDDGMGPQS